jgi:hypothetical protein
MLAFVAKVFSDPRLAAVVSESSAFFALCTLGIQLWVGAKQAKIGSQQADASRISANAAMLTAQSSGNRAVASMRIKWVEDLRAVLSEYHSMLMTRENFEGADLTLMSNLGTKTRFDDEPQRIRPQSPLGNSRQNLFRGRFGETKRA